jgi:hypothetical protein
LEDAEPSLDVERGTNDLSPPKPSPFSSPKERDTNRRAKTGKSFLSCKKETKNF